VYKSETKIMARKRR